MFQGPSTRTTPLEFALHGPGERVIGLYVSSPEHAVVLCVDEKSHFLALDRSKPMLPMRPGQSGHRSHEYRRHGVTSLFATGKVTGHFYSRHRDPPIP